jgi:hypothetical protein
MGVTEDIDPELGDREGPSAGSHNRVNHRSGVPRNVAFPALYLLCPDTVICHSDRLPKTGKKISLQRIAGNWYLNVTNWYLI